jgi:hypothetical protein
MQRDGPEISAEELKKLAAAERKEVNRLRKIYRGLPPKRLAIAQGLIAQAARLRVRLDALNDDITVNGLTEWFQQSEKCEPYKRERPEAAMFVKLDKNYQTIMRQLADLVPPDDETPETMRDAFDCE